MPPSSEDDPLWWRAHGKCIGLPPGMFVLDRGVSAAPAKAVCAGCPVTDECNQYAVKNNEYGVWGGVVHVANRIKIISMEPPDDMRPSHVI